MSGVDHQGLALTDPKMNPTYPWSRKAEGMPIEGDDVPHLVVDAQRLRADVVGPEGEQPVDVAQRAGRALGQPHDVLAVVEPDLQEQHGHQVPEVHEPEHRHGGGGVGRQVHLERALGVPEVQLQRQRRHQQEGERGEQGQAVGGLDGLHPEDPLERGQDEGAGHQPGDERVEDDEDAPLELDLVGVHEPLDAVQDGVHGSPSAPSRRGRCSRSSSPWPSAASAPAPCACAGTRGWGPSGP